MATERDDASGPSPNYGVKAAYILVLAVVVGFLMAVFVTETGESILRWFWIGIAVSAIYLLAALANNAERLRTES